MTSAEHPQGPAAPVEPDAADSDDSQSVERDLSAASHASVSSSASDGQSGAEMTDQPTDRHAPRLRTRAVSRPRRGEAHGHQHRDVSGGWLRPAVFGAMDGLVTNVSLIAGVSGGNASKSAIVLTGLAGLAAGAFSMATGEYVSVSSQNELVQAEVTKERYELEHNPDAEARELAAVFRHRGVDADLAERVARQVGRKPEEALRMHVREELGVDHHDLPSPYVAAGASLVTFAVGALIPMMPYLLGFHALAAAQSPGSPTGRSCAAPSGSCCWLEQRPG